MHSKGFLPLLLLVQCLCQTSAKFHHSLSLREVRSLFHVDSHDEVPDYEVVHINHHRSRRSTESQSGVRVIKLTAFDSDHSLTLKPNKILAKDVPVFYAEHDPQRDKVVVKPALEKLNASVGIPYQDEESMAAITIRTDPESGRDVMDGTIGEDLIIKPLPTSVADLLRKNEDLDSLTWRREEEHNINAIRPPDDQAFLDEGEALLTGDLEFSDQFPLVADDDTKTGQHQLVREPFSESESESNKTLPAGLELLRRRRRAVLESQDMHVVFKRSAKERGAPFDTTFMEEDIINEIKQNRVKRSSGSAPSVIYPEILVLVDYDGYLLHDKDNTKIKSYYVSFWNGADLRYKLLSHPRIKLSIAGIIISRSRDAMPYLERNRVGRDAIDSASALTDMGKYLFQERRLPTYDIAVAITKLDMCRRTYKGSPCNRGTAGFAYVGGACVVNKRLKKVNSVAIVEDTGGFSGIIVAAHEVGHLLGAVHDGSPPPNYLGGPGAQRCRWEDGYIMSDLRHTEKGFKWSDCSVKQFQHFLNGDTATCLYNLPHEDESLPRILPGKLLSLDQQCRKDRGTSACFKDDRVCAQLFCFDAQSGYCVSYRPAAEGSECGGGKVCKNGRCVYDNENSISDHDHGSGDSFFLKSHPKPSTTSPAPTTTTTTSTTPKPTTRRTTTTTKRPTTRRTTTTTTTTKRPTTRRTTTTTKRPTTRRTTTTTTKRPTTRRTTTTPKPTTTTKKPTTRRTTTTTNKPKTTTNKSITLPPTRSTIWSDGRTTWTTSSISSISHRTSVSTTSLDNINNYESYVSDGECNDKVSNITGTLSCRQFLQSYGARYCDHVYIMQNCCKSRREICENRL